MVKGLQRSAGLNLLSFGIRTNIGLGTYRDLLQWFLTSMRQNKHQVAHYSDGIAGCGDSVLTAIRKQFFKIIKTIITTIKLDRDGNSIRLNLPALVWNYKGADMEYLVKFDLINVLQFGDEGRTHPITLSWGKQIKQVKASADKSLTRMIASIFEFIFKQVLSQLILVDAGDDEDQSSKPQIVAAD